MPSNRKPGDAIPPAVIRELRHRRGLTQEALAYQLGLSSGKNVISAWETGRSVCDGPAAELVLRLLGLGDVSIAREALSAEIESEWTRAGDEGAVTFWRQFSAILDLSVELERSKWLDLFPAIAIPSIEHVHGFPFIDRSLAPDVYGIGPKGWAGSIPSRKTEDPGYAWILKRNGSFAYRERAWEVDPRAVTHGHVHVGALLELALQGIFFMRNVVKQWSVSGERKLALHLDTHGMGGRGVVGQMDASGNRMDAPTRVSSDEHIRATIEAGAAQLAEGPVDLGLGLVAELVMPLRPDLAREATLKTQLKRRLEFDSGRGAFRTMGFLKGTKID